MASDVNTGATVGISSTLPTTFDDNITTGYASLTFTLIGEIVDVGELAKAYAVVAHQAVARDYPVKHKDTYDIANVTLNVARDSADAGQVIVQAGLAASASYSFEITLPSGDVANFTGKIIKAGLGSVASGGVITTAIELAIDPESLFEA